MTITLRKSITLRLEFLSIALLSSHARFDLRKLARYERGQLAVLDGEDQGQDTSCLDRSFLTLEYHPESCRIMVEIPYQDRGFPSYLKRMYLAGIVIAAPTLYFVITSLVRLLLSWTSLSCTTDGGGRVSCEPASFAFDTMILGWLMAPAILGSCVIVAAIREHARGIRPSPGNESKGRQERYTVLALLAIGLPYVLLGIAGFLLVAPYAACFETPRFLMCEPDFYNAYLLMCFFGGFLLIVVLAETIVWISKHRWRGWRFRMRRFHR